MKIKVIALAALVGFAAQPAQADLIAGFDFSQYFSDGFLTTDAQTFTNRLSANYSDLDPTNNAGAESAQFGTLFFDGSFGSDNLLADGSGTEPLVPTAAAGGSLLSNLNLPGNGLGNPFDSFTVLASEGQQFTQSLALTARDLVSVVFAADLSSTNLVGSDFVLDFAARTFTGTGQIGIEFSSNGTDFFSVGTVAIDPNDTPFSVSLGGSALSQAFVRVTLGDPAGGQPLLDNVGISASLVEQVPEPSTAALLLFGLGAVAFARRRSAR